MLKKLFVYIQYVLPQHLLSVCMGRLADARLPWLKNTLIKLFIGRYGVNMSEALVENPIDYPTFNRFFIRELKPELRPIASDAKVVISPVDGTIAQIGQINKNQLLQAKAFYFDLDTLLGDADLSPLFYDGTFTTLYLAPHNYHRVHMPLSGSLEKTIYVPGKLFSVNRMTSEMIPHLYSRNERLVCIFNTQVGRVGVILVGAMIVGSIQTVWMDKPIRSKQRLIQSFAKDAVLLEKGEQLGYFKMGSTVILLFGKNSIAWQSQLGANANIVMGQQLGTLIK